MVTTPAARSTPVGPIIATIMGRARESTHGPVIQRVAITLVYRPHRPYDVNLVIAPGRLSCGHPPQDLVLMRLPGLACRICQEHLAPWLVSREVLCSAAMWETPAGMGDFRAAPMAENTTQLTIVDSNPGGDGGRMHIDVERDELLRFLERTIRLVKPGRESRYIDMDQIVTALLGSNR